MARKNYTEEFRRRAESQAARVARLEAENSALKAEARKLETERDILRQAADAALAARNRVLQDPDQGGDRAYGAPRITADLNDGVAPIERVNRKRVTRVMREHQLAGIRLRRRVRTRIPDQSGRRFPDLIERDFTVGEPNRRYAGDITYLPIADGSNLYLASVIDLGSRKLAGWQVADHMRTELVEDALRGAARDRGSLGRGRVSLRPRLGLHLEGLRQALQRPEGHPVHERDRDQCRQLTRGELQRSPQT